MAPVARQTAAAPTSLAPNAVAQSGTAVIKARPFVEPRFKQAVGRAVRHVGSAMADVVVLVVVVATVVVPLVIDDRALVVVVGTVALVVLDVWQSSAPVRQVTTPVPDVRPLTRH